MKLPFKRLCVFLKVSFVATFVATLLAGSLNATPFTPDAPILKNWGGVKVPGTPDTYALWNPETCASLNPGSYIATQYSDSEHIHLLHIPHLGAKATPDELERISYYNFFKTINIPACTYKPYKPKP